MPTPSPDPKYQTGDPPEPMGLDPRVVISSDTQRNRRIPPGQTRTRSWPVLDAHGTPPLIADDWSLEVFGEVRTALRFTLAEFQSLPRVRVFSDFHCVTKWSRLGNLWEGVAAQKIVELAGVRSDAQFVILHGWDHGWTTNLPLRDFLADDVLLADSHDGEPISADHGGPVRVVVPRLYAWKSAKWIKAIEFSQHDRPGYWERGGYHNYGDPWSESRFAES